MTSSFLLVDQDNLGQTLNGHVLIDGLDEPFDRQVAFTNESDGHFWEVV